MELRGDAPPGVIPRLVISLSVCHINCTFPFLPSSIHNPLVNRELLERKFWRWIVQERKVVSYRDVFAACTLLWVEDVVSVAECGDRLCNSDWSSRLAFISSFSVGFPTRPPVSLAFSEFLSLAFILRHRRKVTCSSHLQFYWLFGGDKYFIFWGDGASIHDSRSRCCWDKISSVSVSLSKISWILCFFMGGYGCGPKCWRENEVSRR